MKLTNLKSKKSKSGITLIELTVVILVLLSLISVLFVGARAWLRGSERAQAAVLIRNAQQGCRSHTNILGLETPSGATAPATTPFATLWGNFNGTAPVPTVETGTGTSALLQDAVFGPGAFVETPASGQIPNHPAGGGPPASTATQAEIDNADVFFQGAGGSFENVPRVGDVYMTSSQNASFYAPSGLQ